MDAGQGLGGIGVADGVTDGDVLDARKHDDVTGLGRIGLGEARALVDLELGHAKGPGLAVNADTYQGLVAAGGAGNDPAHGQPAKKIGIAEIRDQHAKRLGRVVGRGRNALQDRLEQRGQVRTLPVQGTLGQAFAADGVQHREFELFLGGIEVDEEVVDFVEDFLGAGVLAVDLVDHDNDGQPPVQGFFKHEAGLGKRPFRGVDQEHGPVDHGQGAFDLAAEIGVAWGVDDVDLDIFPDHGTVFRGDGNAALTFQIHAVHDPVRHLLALAKQTALAEHMVHQGGLPVVDVGDNGNIAQGMVSALILHGGFLAKSLTDGESAVGGGDIP